MFPGVRPRFLSFHCITYPNTVLANSITHDTWYFLLFIQSLGSFYVIKWFLDSVVIHFPQFVGSLDATFFLPPENRMYKVSRAIASHGKCKHLFSLCGREALKHQDLKHFVPKSHEALPQGTEPNIDYSLYLMLMLSRLAKDFRAQAHLLKWNAWILFIWGRL